MELDIINFYDPLPYDHSGRWHKKYDSILNPNGQKITWPQFITECIIYFRTKLLKNYSDVKIGPNWHQPITKDVRQLNQQAAIICNYFKHPDDEPLVIVAFKNWFRNHKPLKMGQFRKNRISTKNGRQVLNIDQAEKDVILGVSCELERLIKQRDLFKNTVKTIDTTNKPIKFQYNTGQSSLSKLLEIEKKLQEKLNG